MNPGLLKGFYVPIYGFGMLLIVMGHHRMPDYPLWSKVIIYTAAFSLLELSIGWFFHRVLGMRLWDYSGNRFNYKGYICPTFSFCWGVLAGATDYAMTFLMPEVERFASSPSIFPDLVVFTILFAILIDLAITLRSMTMPDEKGLEALQRKFVTTALPVITMDEVKKLSACNHHFGKTRLDHVLEVAWMAFRISEILLLDSRAIVKGALLHDLFYYDWLREGPNLHGFRHPRIAFQNASAATDLSRKEGDIIRKHMWPLTVIPPRYPESWAVCLSDITCSWRDYLVPLVNKLIGHGQRENMTLFPSYAAIREQYANCVFQDDEGRGLSILLIDAQPRTLPYTTFRTLSLPRLAGATPAKHTVRILDGRVERIEIPDTGIDLVGVTFSCNNSEIAYNIAQHARTLGITTVAGGPHATAVPDEVLEHFDAVLTGEAEGGAWENLLKDFETGCLKQRYVNAEPPDISNMRPARVDLLKSKLYLPVYPVEATRGCPNKCSFCFNRYIHPTYRKRPVEEVAKDIMRADSHDIIFMDDNLGADREYTRALFTALKPLNKRLYFQTQLSFAEDEEIVRLAAEAGCKGVFVGLESVNTGSLDSVSKTFNHVERYKHLLSTLDRHGIFVIGGLIFGLDADDASVFRETLRFLNETQVCSVAANLPIPYPGTDFHTCVSREHRILETDTYKNYTGYSIIVRPKVMDVEYLEMGYKGFLNEFYAPLHILRRFIKQQRPLKELPIFVLINLSLGLPRRFRKRGIWG